MIVHIGWDTAVNMDDVLMVLTTESAKASPETRAMILKARREDRFTPCPEAEKAYILLNEGDTLRVVASAIRPATLLKRMEDPYSFC